MAPRGGTKVKHGGTCKLEYSKAVVPRDKIKLKNVANNVIKVVLLGGMTITV